MSTPITSGSFQHGVRRTDPPERRPRRRPAGPRHRVPPRNPRHPRRVTRRDRGTSPTRTRNADRPDATTPVRRNVVERLPGCSTTCPWWCASRAPSGSVLGLTAMWPDWSGCWSPRGRTGLRQAMVGGDVVFPVSAHNRLSQPHLTRPGSRDADETGRAEHRLQHHLRAVVPPCG